MTEQNIDTTVDDLFMLSGIVDRFMAVERKTIHNDRRETDGEHTLRLQFMAVAYAAKCHPQLDIGKVALYAMVHDLVEVYAGDTPTLNASEVEMHKKEQREAQAFARLKMELGESWPFIFQMLEAYEQLDDAESRFVRTFDKCDPGFTHYRNKGIVLGELGLVSPELFWQAHDATYQRMLPYCGDFQDVTAVRDKIGERIASVAYSDV